MAPAIRTLLVIEDNPGDARLLREMLVEDGKPSTNVVHVETIRDAEAHLAANAVDVILLDLGLPDAQGLEAVRRAHAAAPHVPLVILTGLDDESLAVNALQIGAQDYLVKGQIETRGLSRALRYAVERNLLDGALFAERERAQVTLDSIGDAVASTDLAGDVTFLNAVGQALTGWTLEEARGQPIAEVLNLHDATTRQPAAIGESQTGPLDLPGDAILFRRDGGEIAIEGSRAPIHDRDGRSVGAVIVVRDVTERRGAEQAMWQSQLRFRRLFDAHTIGIAIADLAGRTLEVNNAYVAMLGYSRSELLARGQGWNDLTPPEYHDRSENALAELLATGVAEPFEKEYIRADGTRIPVLVGVAMLDASESTCIMYIVDLSARRLLEDRLRHAQKMEAIGQLAGGVAHDFNNLLTVILGHANLLVDELEAHEALRESAEEIREAGNRAVTMTRQLLAFSHRQVLEPKILDLNAVVATLEGLLRQMVGEDVSLLVEPLPEVALVLADAGQVEQVLMNFAVNARDAMPEGGALTIVLGTVTLAGTGSSEPRGLAAGPYITVSVGDTGSGMTAETKEHLFEPFFTTKSPEQGTGLGLATAYGIVKQSGGDIRVASEPGEGAILTVYLPRVAGMAETVAATARIAMREPVTETLLLVEDDAAVRRLTKRILEARGYRVIEAADGREALNRAAAHDGLIDLLLTDVVLPHLGGRELARQIRVLRPETAIVYMSGFADDTVLEETGGGQALFILKPFTADGLADRLRDAVPPAPAA
jgi:two-component system, cell cycle sensor histidine kinase and response regulator CckA